MSQDVPWSSGPRDILILLSARPILICHIPRIWQLTRSQQSIKRFNWVIEARQHGESSLSNESCTLLTRWTLAARSALYPWLVSIFQICNSKTCLGFGKMTCPTSDVMAYLHGPLPFFRGQFAFSTTMAICHPYFCDSREYMLMRFRWFLWGLTIVGTRYDVMSKWLLTLIMVIFPN